MTELRFPDRPLYVTRDAHFCPGKPSDLQVFIALFSAFIAGSGIVWLIMR